MIMPRSLVNASECRPDLPIGARQDQAGSSVPGLRCAREGTVGDVLLLINGAPGVGKSTLAHRYADEHPLALIIDIDSIRTRLGQWAKFDKSKLVARDLALALTRAHLPNGYDVIVPQYLGRPEYRERLQLVARETDVPFVEVLLTDDADRITQRFRRRRAEYASTGAEHPEGDLSSGVAPR
jgi:predicted kinase